MAKETLEELQSDFVVSTVPADSLAYMYFAASTSAVTIMTKFSSRIHTGLGLICSTVNSLDHQRSIC